MNKKLIEFLAEELDYRIVKYNSETPIAEKRHELGVSTFVFNPYADIKLALKLAARYKLNIYFRENTVATDVSIKVGIKGLTTQGEAFVMLSEYNDENLAICHSVMKTLEYLYKEEIL